MTTITSAIENIKMNDNLLCSLELPEYSLKCYLVYMGGNKVEYYVFRNDVLLFHGKDFKPSPLYDQDSLACVISLLAFLTCKPGDTDDDYFINYTKDQLNWANSSDCEQLGVVIMDFESDNDELDNVSHHSEAVEYLNQYFSNS